MSKRLRIAMVAALPFTCPRGSPVRVHRLAEALANRGHDVDVVTYHLGDRIENAPFSVHRIPRVLTYRKTDPGPSYQKLLVLDTLLLFKLRQVLRHHMFDLIHAHHYEGLISSLGARWNGRSRIPIIFDAHTLLEGELPFYHMGLPRPLKRWIGRRLDRTLPRLADGIIAVSDEIRQQLVRVHALAPERIEVIGGGVELELFSNKRDAGTIDRRQPKTLIYCGTLASYQGIDLMLEAFAQLMDVRRDVRLLLATDSSFAPYEALARHLAIRDHIDLVAADFANLPVHLCQADVALNPRKDCDGYSQKVINYMAAAKPIVSSAGSAKTLDHGKTAWLVENPDAGSFAKAIMHLLTHPDLAAELGRNARSQIAREHSWDRSAAAAENFYQTLLEQGITAKPSSRIE